MITKTLGIEKGGGKAGRESAGTLSKAQVEAIAKEKLEGKDLRQTLTADMEVSLEELNFDVLKHLAYLEPTGYGNPDAVFVARDVKVRSLRTVGSDARHLKLSLEDSSGAAYECIGFRMAEMQKSLPPRLDAMFNLEANEWNGRTTLQLNLKDIKAAGIED